MTASSDPALLLLKSIEQISALLNTADLKQTNLDQAMGLVCSTTNAEYGLLYSRLYRDREGFSLKSLGRAGNTEALREMVPEEITPRTVPASTWDALNRGQLFSANTLELHPALQKRYFSICPLFFEGKPFGLLLLLHDRQAVPDLDPTLQSFLTVLSNILELWINKINVKKRFEDVFDSSPNPSFIMAADDRIVFWNKANEEMTGWRSEDLIGKTNYTSSIPYYGIRRPMVANLIMQPAPEWQSTYFEFNWHGDDRINALAFCPALPGGGAYLRTNTIRLYDFNNRLWGAIHTVRDVTIERKIREHLQRSESMYRAIADFAGIGILLLRNQEIVYANEQLEEFIGIQFSGLSYQRLRSWIQPSEFRSIDEIITKVFSDKQGPVRFEFTAERQHTLSHFNALAQLISYEGNDVIHLVIDDISEQKELDRRARFNELRLFHEERLTSLGTMAAGIAHELNQPLNTIRVITEGFLFCVEKGWGMEADEWHENVELISRQVVRMSSVIQTIRNFARNDLSQECTDISINTAIESVFSMIGRQMEAHNITVKKILDPDMPTIKAPPNRLEQVVTNLLINARQALDECNHDHRSIRIETGTRGTTAFLEISDNATGIPEELHKKIFDPFFTTKDVGQGTGLGLSISQSIVASINGKLELRNNREGGATFTVNIPKRS